MLTETPKRVPVVRMRDDLLNEELLLMLITMDVVVIADLDAVELAVLTRTSLPTEGQY